VIEHLDAPAASDQGNRKQRKLPAAQQRALDLLIEAIVTAGEHPPASNHVPSGARGVTHELWQRYCYQGGISTGESENAARMAFKRSAEALLADGRIGTWNGWVWLA
jgi:hypothetical protein